MRKINPLPPNMYARIIAPLLLGVLLLGCATPAPTRDAPIAIRPGAEVFQLPQEAGFQSELLELKDGRFRYWFSGDNVAGDVKRATKYPTEGRYKYEDHQLVLSDGQVFAIREMNGVRSLWRQVAVDYWTQHRIIDAYGILLPVHAVDSSAPALKPFFTSEQWAESAEEGLRQLERAKK